MQAATWRKYGPPEVLRIEDIEAPAIKADEILIRVMAANVFPGDCELRRYDMPGLYLIPLRLFIGLWRPREKLKVLGQEVSGIVESVGAAVTDFKPGDAVTAPTPFGGGYAEFARVRAAVTIYKPASLTHVEAAGMSVGGLNALHFLRIAQVSAGQRILLVGAGGCIGTMAVQIARAWGAHVTAVDDTEKCSKLLEIGANAVVDYTRDDYTDVAEPYDAIIDIVGRGPYAKMVGATRKDGFLVLGNAPTRHVLRRTWSRFTCRCKVRIALTGYRQADLSYLARLVEEGKVKPVVDRVYPLHEIIDAHRFVETGRRFGNVVLQVADSTGESGL